MIRIGKSNLLRDITRYEKLIDLLHSVKYRTLLHEIKSVANGRIISLSGNLVRLIHREITPQDKTMVKIAKFRNFLQNFAWRILRDVGLRNKYKPVVAIFIRFENIIIKSIIGIISRDKAIGTELRNRIHGSKVYNNILKSFEAEEFNIFGDRCRKTAYLTFMRAMTIKAISQMENKDDKPVPKYTFVKNLHEEFSVKEAKLLVNMKEIPMSEEDDISSAHDSGNDSSISSDEVYNYIPSPPSKARMEIPVITIEDSDSDDNRNSEKNSTCFIDPSCSTENQLSKNIKVKEETENSDFDLYLSEEEDEGDEDPDALSSTKIYPEPGRPIPRPWSKQEDNLLFLDMCKSQLRYSKLSQILGLPVEEIEQRFQFILNNFTMCD